MRKPLFSIVIITKNEENTLPRLFDSLKEFQSRGGEVVVLDTGSTDNTIQTAMNRGAVVFNSTDFGQFITTLGDSECMSINERFVADDDPPIVHFGNKLFNFSMARNTVSKLACNDFIVTMDADEAYSVLDIDKINDLIEQGYQQLEYQFVYAHDSQGRPAVQFIQSKAFDRRVMEWEGIVHEVLQGNAKRILVDESIIKLEHWQEPGKEHRGNYLVGLAYDCYQNPNKDRQSHYLARELMYTGRYKSAIKEFERHITMGGWVAEKAQSMIFMGDCFGKLNEPMAQLRWYAEAFATDSSRREALIKTALFYQHNNNWHGAAAYASAALQIPFVDYYANERHHYEDLPHSILYQALGWMGDIKGAQDHLWKCLQYQPYNEKYLHDTRYYFEYPAPDIDGWMTFEELSWLYNMANGRHKIIVEIGSWKGRSTHAILSGSKNTSTAVFAVDTWQGAKDPMDATNWLAKQEDIFEVFTKNTSWAKNLATYKMTSIQGAGMFEDETIGVCFIDAGHTKEELSADIKAWLPKVKKGGILCGHDYMPGTWMGVVEAVNELLGGPDEVHGTIWVKYIK